MLLFASEPYGWYWAWNDASLSLNLFCVWINVWMCIVDYIMHMDVYCGLYDAWMCMNQILVCVWSLTIAANIAILAANNFVDSHRVILVAVIHSGKNNSLMGTEPSGFIFLTVMSQPSSFIFLTVMSQPSGILFLTVNTRQLNLFYGRATKPSGKCFLTVNTCQAKSFLWVVHKTVRKIAKTSGKIFLTVNRQTNWIFPTT